MERRRSLTQCSRTLPKPPPGPRRRPPHPQGASGPLSAPHSEVEEPEPGKGSPSVLGCRGDSGESRGEVGRAPDARAGKEKATVAIKREGDQDRDSGDSQTEAAVLGKRGNGKKPRAEAAVKAEPPDAAFDVCRGKPEKAEAPAGLLCRLAFAGRDECGAPPRQGLAIRGAIQPSPPEPLMQVQGPLQAWLSCVNRALLKRVPLQTQPLLQHSVNTETRNVPVTLLPSDAGIALTELARRQKAAADRLSDGRTEMEGPVTEPSPWIDGSLYNSLQSKT